MHRAGAPDQAQGVPPLQANMALRPEQRNQLLQLRRQLLESLAALLQERCVIQALMKASLQSNIHIR